MNDFKLYIGYIVLGLIGGSGHYLKKRYIDDTTSDSFFHYLTSNFKSTKQATVAIIGSSISLALAHTGVVGMQEIISVLTAGYMVDSVINRDSGL